MDLIRPRPGLTARASLAGLVLALTVLCAACDRKNAYVPPPPPAVTVSHPVKQQVTEYLEFTGTTQALESVDLRARVEGFLDSVNFADGAMVKEGDLLFRIQSQQYEANLQEAKAQLVSDQARLSRAETEYARAKRLFQEKAGPDTDVVKWEAERDSALAGMALDKAKIELAELDLSYTRIIAPFSGRIGRRQVDPGNLVGAGEKTLLATIIRFDPIYVYFTMNERDLLRVIELGRHNVKNHREVPLQMAISDSSGYPFTGQLDYVDLGVDPNTGTLLLRGIFPNPKINLLPGLFVRLRAAIATREALLVPERAVGVDQTGSFVLVVGDKNVVEQRSVTQGIVQDGLVAVEGKLSTEDRVIVNGLQRARPGAEVKPEEAPPPAAPAAAATSTAPKS
jgi:RND family efflux transporter MFP subunit